MVFFLVMLVVVVGFAVCAYLHSQREMRGALTLLWILTLLLWAGVVLSAASVGVLLLPIALLAMATSVVASLAQARAGAARLS
jgi:predicted membrane protein